MFAQFVLANSDLMNVRGVATCSTGIACGTAKRLMDRNIHKQVVADLSQRLIATLYSAPQSQSDWYTNIHIAGLQNYICDIYQLNEESNIHVFNVVTRIICLNSHTHKT